jgi:hypothetical protein
LDARKLWWLKFIRWNLWLTVVAGVGAFFYWAAFLAFSGYVTPEGKCVFYAVYPEVIVAFSVSDFFLASGMFGIFVFPLWEHAKEMTETGVAVKATQQLNAMIRKNLIFSSLAMLSAFLCLNFEAGVMWIARDDGTSNADQLREWGLFIISIDNWVGIFLIHCMTSAWLPSFFRRSQVVSSGPTGTSSHSPNNAKSTSGNEKEATTENQVVPVTD